LVVGSLHPEGLEVRSRDSSLYAAMFVLRVFYLELQLLSIPRSSMIPPKTTRIKKSFSAIWLVSAQSIWPSNSKFQFDEWIGLFDGFRTDSV